MDGFKESVPTFYEMILQDKMQEMLLESAKFTLRVFFDRFPSLTPLRYWTSSIASLLIGALDSYSLYRTDGNFAENFYSLRRIPGFSPWNLLKYLSVSYIFPVLAEHSKYHSFLVRAFEIAKGLCMLGFLYLKFPYFSPGYFVLRQKIVREAKASPFSYAVLILLVALKFLEMVVNARIEKRISSEVRAIPPPYNDSQVPKGICFICKGTPANPAALTVSGYVFCYACVKKHVEVFSSCPVTNQPALSRHIRVIRM